METVPTLPTMTPTLAPNTPRSPPARSKYTSLDGSAEQQGDLKSIVLHNLEVSHVKSTFPISLGARPTVDPLATRPDTSPAPGSPRPRH